MAEKKSVNKILAEATADGARAAANGAPNDKRAQELAALFEKRARDTK